MRRIVSGETGKQKKKMHPLKRSSDFFFSAHSLCISGMRQSGFSAHFSLKIWDINIFTSLSGSQYP